MVEIGLNRGCGPVSQRVFQRFCPSGTPQRRVKAYSLQRTLFESIAERKLRRRQLTEDENVEISGRDVRRVSVGAVPAAEECLKSTHSSRSLCTDLV